MSLPHVCRCAICGRELSPVPTLVPGAVIWVDDPTKVFVPLQPAVPTAAELEARRDWAHETGML